MVISYSTCPTTVIETSRLYIASLRSQRRDYVIVDVIIFGLYWGAPLYLLQLLAWSGEREAGAAKETGGNLGGDSGNIGKN